MSSPTPVVPGPGLTAPRGPNPFVGPRSIRQGERIYGRKHETAELRDRLIADRIVLMYSPSGAGKTSLINAGLRPELAHRGFTILPTIRVNHVDPVMADMPGYNRYRLSMLLSLEEGREDGRHVPPKTLVQMSLAQYLDKVAAHHGEGHDFCLIFDQFEELLTLDQADLEQKRQFMDELGDVLRDRRWWVLFSMREDFVAPLDPYLDLMPTRLGSHYRLELLTAEAATAAACEAAAHSGVHFAEDAAAKLINDLRTVRAQFGDEVVETPGPYVEPVQLQVVCSQLWDRLAPSATTIELADVVQLGNVDDALGDYYEQRIAAAAAASGVAEREIRQWIEDALITEQGFRDQSLVWTRQGGDKVLTSLEDNYIVRTETHRGARWYELAHDRLVDPIRDANERWRNEHLSILQARAGDWHQHGKPTGLLIGGKVLAQAEQWAATHPDELNEVDREYLDKSRAMEANALRLRRSSRRNLILAIAAGVALVVALAFWADAKRSEQQARDAEAQARAAEALAVDEKLRADAAAEEAERQKEEAERQKLEADEQREAADRARRTAEAAERSARAGEVAARSRAVQLENAALAMAVAAESTGIADDPLDSSFAAIASARSKFRERNWQPVFDRIEQTGAGQVAFHPDGDTFASGGCADLAAPTPCAEEEANTIYLRSATDPNAGPTALRGHAGQILDLAYNADGVLASTSGEGMVRVWGADGSERPPLPHPAIGDPGAEAVVRSVAFDPTNPNVLVTGDDNGRVWSWDLAADPPVSRVFDRAGFEPAGRVNDVTVRYDGKLVASAESNGNIVLWDEDGGRAIKLLAYPRLPADPVREAFRVEFVPETEPGPCPEERGLPGCIDALVAGHAGGSMWFWESPNSDNPSVVALGGHGQDVKGLSFDPAGTGLMASSSGDRTIRLWRFEKLDNGSRRVTPVGGPLSEHTEFVSDVAFSPDGSRLVSSSTDNTLRLWGAPEDVGIAVLGAPIECGESPDCFTTAVAFNHDDTVLASTGFDGAVRFWDAQAGEPHADLPAVEDGQRMYAIEFHPDDDIAIVGGHGRVLLWDRSEPDVLTPLWTDERYDALQRRQLARNQVPAVRAVAFDDTTGLAATADECGTIRIWDATTREQVGELETAVRTCPLVFDQDRSETVDALAFRPGFLIYGDAQGCIWEVPMTADGELGEAVQIGVDQNGKIRGVAVSDDGIVAAASKDQTLQVSTSELTQIIRGHKAEVGAVAFGDDYLASASNDGTIRLWWLDVESSRIDTTPATGEVLASSRRCQLADPCFVLGLAFSHDSTMLASVGSDGLVHVWDRPDSAQVACSLAAPFLERRQVQDALEGAEPSVCY